MRDLESSLQAFGEFLLKGQLVRQNAAPYFVRWVRRFLSREATNEALVDQVRSFCDDLERAGQFADWQIRQAEQALRLYFVNFLNRTDWSCNVAAPPARVSLRVRRATPCHEDWTSIVRTVRATTKNGVCANRARRTCSSVPRTSAIQPPVRDRPVARLRPARWPRARGRLRPRTGLPSSRHGEPDAGGRRHVPCRVRTRSARRPLSRGR